MKYGRFKVAGLRHINGNVAEIGDIVIRVSKSSYVTYYFLSVEWRASRRKTYICQVTKEEGEKIEQAAASLNCVAVRWDGY